MKLKWWVIIIVIVVLVVAGIFAYQYRVRLYSEITSRGLNAKGGDITIVNARIWTGDPADPWKEAMTVRGGKIVAMNADEPAGKVIDAEGRLVIPGMWDGHCHPQTPYILMSPEAPMLFEAKSIQEVLNILRDYAKAHPEDKYPRLFGWTDDILEDGQKPTRQMIDEVVSDRPVYLIHHNGHCHWANTKALEIAGILKEDPPDNIKGTSHIERDPETGLATGYLTETELAATHGLLLNTVKKVEPLTFDQQVLIQRMILEEYSKVGVTGVWTKDGDIDITRIYEQILRDDALPVRAVLDNLYTYFCAKDDLQTFAQRAKEIEDSDLPKGFLRANGVKLIMDLPYHTWMFEAHSDREDFYGFPLFEMEEIRRQILEADRLGLQINILAMGDRAIHEGLNLLEEAAKANPPRQRRHCIEHADFIADGDIPRFKELDVIPVGNPIAVYPQKGFQEFMVKMFGKERLDKYYERWKELIEAGATLVQGSDFPIGPMNPMLGLHLMVNCTDENGQPEGGLWPQKTLSIENALRTYTVNAAYAAFEEHRLGRLKEGYEADFVILSENILNPAFEKERLLKVKPNLTVFNGHIVHQDFSDKEKKIEFGH